MSKTDSRSSRSDTGWVPFNINDFVRVKLTPEGKAHLKAWTDELNVYVLARGGEPLKYLEVKEDAEGWSEWQLWSLMDRLGEHCHMGPPPPFETTIEFKANAVRSEQGTREPASYTAGRQREADAAFVRSLINSTGDREWKGAFSYAADLLCKNTLVAKPFERSDHG